jgi:hypothetical protein
LFRSEIFFPTTQELEYFFLVAQSAKFFFQNLTLGYITKTLNQIIFFFLHQNQNIFFSNNIFLEKKTYLPPPPLQVKWSFPYINVYRKTSNIKIYHYIFDYKQTTFTYVDNICQINVYQKIKSAAIMNIH